MTNHETLNKPPYGMIAILFVGAFVSFVNETFLNVALPSIMKDFEISPSSAQWLSTGYMLINGILIPASAFLLQVYESPTIYYSNGLVYSRYGVSFTFADIRRVIGCKNVSSGRFSDHGSLINECHACRFSC